MGSAAISDRRTGERSRGIMLIGYAVLGFVLTTSLIASLAEPTT